MRKRTLKTFKRCEVCGNEIPRDKFSRHQFWLGGVRATLCKGMGVAKREAYERLSSKLLRKAKTQARLHGYSDPVQVEAYLRGLGYGEDAFPKKKKKMKQGK